MFANTSPPFDLGPIPDMPTEEPQQIFYMIHMLALLDPEAAGRYLLSLLRDEPDAISTIYDYPSDYDEVLVAKISAALPEGVVFNRGYYSAKTLLYREYGIWPEAGFFDGLESLAGTIAHDPGTKRELYLAEVSVGDEKQARIRSVDETGLLAAEGLVDTLHTFGFRGELTLFNPPAADQATAQATAAVVFRANLGELEKLRPRSDAGAIGAIATGTA